MPTSTRLPLRKVRAWAVHCWPVQALPMRWHLPSASPLSPFTILKAICSRPCWQTTSLNFHLLLCWYRADIRNLWLYAVSAITPCWVKVWMMRQAKRLIKRPSFWACLIPAVPNYPSWLNSARLMPSYSHVLCSIRTICR